MTHWSLRGRDVREDDAMSGGPSMLGAVAKGTHRVGWALVILGMLAALAPVATGAAMVVVIGLVLLAAAALIGLWGWQTREAGKGNAGLVVAALGAMAGLLLVVQPTAGLSLVRLLLIGYFLLSGAAEIAAAWELRPSRRQLDVDADLGRRIHPRGQRTVGRLADLRGPRHRAPLGGETRLCRLGCGATVSSPRFRRRPSGGTPGTAALAWNEARRRAQWRLTSPVRRDVQGPRPPASECKRRRPRRAVWQFLVACIKRSHWGESPRIDRRQRPYRASSDTAGRNPRDKKGVNRWKRRSLAWQLKR